MAQLSNDCFAFGGQLMSVDEAVRLLLERVPVITQAEDVGLLDADGRILADCVTAPLDVPPFDNAAVDGYAVRHADLKVSGETILPVSGRVAAGHPPSSAAEPGTAVRIFTGAPMPSGTDMVFMQEDCRRIDDRHVGLPAGLKRGANWRARGEDLRQGEEALSAGRRLIPQDIGLAAALGLSRLTVRRPLRVAVFSTGDEIVSPGERLRPATLYDSNRFVLQVLLRRLAALVTDLGILPDHRQRVGAALAQAARTHDLVLSSGGVSSGDEDHVRAAVANTGSLVFWRLAIKPGRPVAMGVIDGTPFVGLPGNPVAVFVTFAFIVQPLIVAMCGGVFRQPLPLAVRSAFSYRKKPGRREYVRVRLSVAADGAVEAHNYPVQGAGIVTSLTRTHGLVQLLEDVTAIEPGDPVGFIDFGLLR